MSSPSTPFCNNCQRSPPEVILLPCTNCSQTTYCSRPCEHADLATHQNTCNRTPSPFSPLPPPDQNHDPFLTTNNPQEPTHYLPLPLRIRNPHSRLLTNKFLHNLPQQDVYTILIDTYRLHLHEQTKYGLDLPPSSSPHHQAADLSRFLSLASCRIKPNPVLPPWWTESSLNTLLMLSTGARSNHILPNLPPETKQWLDLTKNPTISKNDIRNHYYAPYRQRQSPDDSNSNDDVDSFNGHSERSSERGSGKGDFVLQLRYLAQVIYGHPTTGGISFKPTVTLLAEIEKRKGWVEDRRFWEYLRS